MLNARIVYQHINRAKALLGRSNHLSNLIGLTHVGAVIIHRNSIGLYRSNGSLFITKTVHHHIRTLRRHRFSHCQTDSTG